MMKTIPPAEGETNREPIAIIGMGCRFPGGVTGPESFWEFLCKKGDAITEVPPERWNLDTYYDPDRSIPGKMYTCRGGFLDHIDLFDAQFFGISPRETVRMDPQHRILLEVLWETMEDAGLVAERLAGSNTGVFIGQFMHDYRDIQIASTNRELIDAHTATGTSMAITANRLSYLFDFQGPSLTLDTACSSAMIAVHLACQSLINGESSLAFAGGVNLITKPEMMVAISKAGMVSPDGYCKAFDARANGYVRSEGVGLVCLKRLSHAITDGDKVYAVILSSGTNQDGRTSGITVPSGEAQKKLMQDVYRKAGVAPEEIRYFEAHGTGTAVGDPIEARAIGELIGRARPANDGCIVGSVKTNIGHLESAAGIAGLIKATLALKHGQIPPNLHFETPNPAIPFDELHLNVPTSIEPWPADGNGRRLAGVNSFGFGGANAHLLLEGAESFLPEAPQVKEPQTSQNGHILLPLSARSPEALQSLARSYLECLTPHNDNPIPSLMDMGFTASLRRAHHNYRLTLVADAVEVLQEHLQAFLDEERRPGMASGAVHQTPPSQIAFVFCGNGPQWWGMGQQLLEREPVFRAVIEQCDALLKPLASWSLLEEMTRDEQSCRYQETQIAQPTLIALQAGLLALWQSWGVEPDAVVGHSVGEVTAAYASGILSLEDALRVVFHRSRLQQQLAGQGTMLAVGVAKEQITHYLPGYENQISVAAVNSASSLTLSGDEEALKDIAQQLEQQGIFNRFLRIDIPFHSPLLAPLKSEIETALQGIRPQPARILFISTATGKRLDGAELGPPYWYHNMRDPVLFSDAIETLRQMEFSLFLEIGPHPVVTNYVRECFTAVNEEAAVVPTLRRKETEMVMMLGAWGSLYAHGYPVDWNRLYSDGGRFIPLPTYPWQHEQYWNESEASLAERLGWSTQRAMLGQLVHPLLGSRLKTAQSIWDVGIDLKHLKYLSDHKVQGAVIYPAAAYVEMAFAVEKEVLGESTCLLEEVEFQKALFLSENATSTLQFRFDQHANAFDIYSPGQHEKKPWTRHAHGKLYHLPHGGDFSQIDLTAIMERCTQEYTGPKLYNLFQQAGFEYGETFQGIDHIWCGKQEALARLHVPRLIKAEWDDYALHPAILDACFQTMIAAASTEGTYLPVKIHKVYFWGHPEEDLLWSHATLEQVNGSLVVGNIRLVDESGKVLIDIRGFQCRAINQTARTHREVFDECLFEYQWLLQPRPGQKSPFRAADAIPSPKQLVEDLQPEARQLCTVMNRQQYYDVVDPGFDQLCSAYALQAFHKLGWQPQIGERFSVEILADQLKIVDQQRKIFARILAILGDEGILDKVGEQLEVRQWPAAEQPEKIWKRLIRQYPAYLAELTLLGKCGPKLAEVLQGTEDPLQLIFPEGSSETAEHLFQDAPTFQIYNLLIQQAMSHIMAHIPDEQTVRILEIGGGTGGVTCYTLPVLPAHRTEYVFTDISQTLLNAAKQKFYMYPFVEYEILDMECDPLEQGFETHSFDIVLVADVIHATCDLRKTLRRIQQLLAPHGLLIIAELTSRLRINDFVWGLLKGWWAFTDVALRPSHPLLPRQTWLDILQEHGFAEVASLAETDVGTDSVRTIFFVRQAADDHAPQATTSEIRPSKKRGSWLIFSDEQGIGRQVGALLRQSGNTPVFVSPGDAYQQIDAEHIQINPERPEDFRHLFETALNDGLPPCRGMLHAWSLNIENLETTDRYGCPSVLHIIQAWAAIDWKESPQLWLITGQTQEVGNSINTLAVHQSPLWGLGRTIMNEHPRLSCRLVDLSSSGSSDEIESLYQEIMSEEKEDELALRGNARYVHRLNSMPLRVLQRRANTSDAAFRPENFRVEIPSPKLIENMTVLEVERRAPGPDEVEIQVIASGLNFKDVAKATGLLDETAFVKMRSGGMLGLECSGIITAVGEGVAQWKPGDEVIVFGEHCFSQYILSHVRWIFRKPQHLTFEEAATIPLVFLTAYHALHYLCRITKDDKVLIHSAAGGVGLAAIQIAQQVEAEIFATAGDPRKRSFLKDLGVPHVMDSRSLAFVDEILEQTGGKGVNIVLNSLPPRTIDKSISVLDIDGRFVDISNIYGDGRVNLRTFQRGLSFVAFELDQIFREKPEFLLSEFREILEQFESNTYSPLPYRVFPVSSVQRAFKAKADARHVGKLVLSLQDPGVQAIPAIRTPALFTAEGTYLISGGLGGFGVATSEWLVDHGVRHLVLIGRSGASTPEAQAAVERMRAKDAEVVVLKADVSKEQDIAGVLKQIRNTMPPLRGVIHAAMVLDDATIVQMTQEAFQKAMRPKVAGAWHLHTQTLHDDLDYFILYSSATAVIGNPGQANYTAANVFLDTLARHRRLQGLPALSINWGAIADVGYVARNKENVRIMGQSRYESIPSQLALTILNELLKYQAVHTAVARIDWNEWAGMFEVGSSPKFSWLIERDFDAEGQDEELSQGSNFMQTFRSADDTEQPQLLQTAITQQIAKVLGTTPAKIKSEQPISEMGIDSLMTVELINRIKTEIGVELNTVELLNGPSISQLTLTILDKLTSTDHYEIPNVDNLSEEELDALLAAEMGDA